MDARAAVIRRVVYPLWVRRNRSSRLRFLRQMRESQYWPEERIRTHQLARLQAVVRHAYLTCAYYRSKFDAAGVHPDHIRALADATLIPTLSKEEIQKNCEGMISEDYRSRPLIEDRTGGSTGAPMRFFYDAERRDWREAATLRHDQWTGWDIGASKAILWGASQDMKQPPDIMAWLRQRLVERFFVLDASALDERAMASFAAELVTKRPYLLLSYANTLGHFARYAKQAGVRGISPGAIITSAEVLTRETRAEAESAFGCRIYNRYGCREFAVVASQCEQLGPMHVNAENLLVEVLVNGDTRSGEDGEIVVTDLRNMAMPMIRYAIKDVGRLVDGRCECGRTLPLLEMAAGRVTDFLTATSGSKVSGIVIATYVSTSVRGVGQMQIEQREHGRVTVRVARASGWADEQERELATRLREYLGNDMRIEFEFVDRIPHEDSGKFRFSISHL